MAYTPITTMFNSPINTLFNSPFSTSTTILSPLTPYSVRPVSPLSPLSVSIPNHFSPISTITQSIITNNNPLTVVTPIGPIINTIRPSYIVDIDTGMEDNYNVQRDITKYLLYKTLDKWIFNEFPSVLKYLVVEKDSIRIVKNETEKENNDISKNSSAENEMKVDWIENNIFGEEEMKGVLKRIIIELGIKFYDLPHRENIVMEVVEKYLKKKLRKHMESN